MSINNTPESYLNDVCILKSKLREKENELEQAVSQKLPKTVLEQLTNEVNAIKKEINSKIDENNLETPRKKYSKLIFSNFNNYRDINNESNVSISEIADSEIDTIISAQPNIKIVLQPSKFQTKKPRISFSTPLPNKYSECKVNFEKQIEDIPENERSVENAIKTIKAQLSIEVKPEILNSFFENKNNLGEFQESLKQGVGIFELLNDFRKKIFKQEDLSLTEGAKIKVRESLQNFDNKQILSETKTEESGDEGNTEYFDMNSSISQVRGLSLKDALELIPRFNGHNISLSQFLDGCQEAKSILPESIESELAKLVRIRLYGEALSSARGQTFNTIREIAEFFEKIFGSLKTYHEWNGELARTKQKQTESVITFLNRIREIEQEIFKAARREDRVKNEKSLMSEIEKDAIKYFLRGLKWEIRARMNVPEDWRNAREEALEIEREFAGSEIEDEQQRNKITRETRKIHYVGQDENICAYCKRVGHVATNCLKFARDNLQNGRPNFHRPRDNNNYSRNFSTQRPYFSRNNNESNTNFGGWNAENRQRIEFLPGRFENSMNRNTYSPRNYENSRYPSNYTNNIRSNFSSENRNASRFNGSPAPAQGAAPSGGYDNKRTTCFYCGKSNHVVKDCFKYKRDIEQAGPPSGNGPSLSLNGIQRERETETRAPLKETGTIPKSKQ